MNQIDYRAIKERLGLVRKSRYLIGCEQRKDEILLFGRRRELIVFTKSWLWKLSRKRPAKIEGEWMSVWCRPTTL